jgi:DNA helicase-2/ATP-dependent DNA helicase PcrA
MSNILEFKDRYDPELIILTENYRSSQKILDTAGRLIEHNKERLINTMPGLDKNLVARGKSRSVDIKPGILEYPNITQEEAALVREISGLYESGFDLSKVAVIYRKHTQVENIVKALSKAEIPLNIRKRVNILELRLMQKLLTILTYIHEEYNQPSSREDLLVEILHYDFLKLDQRDLSRILLHWRLSRRKDTDTPHLGEYIEQFIENDNSRFKDPGKIIDALYSISQCINAIVNTTLQGLFERILVNTGVIAWIMEGDEKAWHLQVITSFFDFIKEETAKNPLLGLNDFLEMLSRMDADGIDIPVNKVMIAQKGVNLITAHSAKGLEFERVYLFGTNRKIWEMQSVRYGYPFPATLSSSKGNASEEDERRLFYVALTRA